MEHEPRPELSLRELAREELKAAEDRETELLREMDEVLATTPDRHEAERIILERIAPEFDKAQKDSRTALEKWLALLGS
jgi:hypothetical protein